MTFSVIVLTYSLICLYSFFNVSYVRDFDAIQVNFTPIVLTIISLYAMVTKFDFAILGMFVGLVTDSYFALRTKQNKENIMLTAIELFSMESWTQ